MMLMTVMAAMVMAAEPAQGSAEGVWAYGELMGDYDSSPTLPSATSWIGVGANAVLGYGIPAGHARVVPSVGAGFLIDSATRQTPGGLQYGLGVDVAVSVTDLVNEVHSGLRLSPLIGFSHSVRTPPPSPFVVVPPPTNTQLNVGFTLERRFGPVEVAYTPRGRHYFSSNRCGAATNCLTPQWEVSQQLFAEAWALPELSFALGAWWTVSWNTQSSDPQHLVGGSGTVTWAPFSFGGFAMSVWYGRALEWRGSAYDALVGSVSFWLRTDAKLQRNWLER